MGILFDKNSVTEHIVNTTLQVRLDRYLRRIVPTLSQGVIEQYLRAKKIKVNNKKALSCLRVVEGDKISLPVELLRAQNIVEHADPEFSSSAVTLAKKLLGEYLLFENQYFFVINKPAKLATQGGSKINLSIDDALNYLNFQNKTEYKLVHRLDKETSGILIIAKSYISAVKLTQSFKDKLIKKTYLAVVAGKMPKSEGEISRSIAKNREGVYDKVQEDLTNGKPAITKYKVLEKFEDVCLLEFTPITGRTHQLRVHAQMLRCPIVGDSKYGSQMSISSGNMLLHAESMTLPAEIFGEEFNFHAQLPEYFKKFIEARN